MIPSVTPLTVLQWLNQNRNLFDYLRLWTFWCADVDADFDVDVVTDTDTDTDNKNDYNDGGGDTL